MAQNVKFKEWQCPPQSSADSYKIGWLNEQAEDGQAWVKSQRGYSDWHKAFEVIAGRNDLTDIPKYRSKISTARLKRNIKQVRGAVTNIRPIWGFSSQNPAFAQRAMMMNKVVTAVYQQQFLDKAVKGAFDWAAATNTGWFHPVYRRDMAGRGKGNLYIDTFGQPCILPTQLPSSGDFQNAYAVTLLDELPIYMAHGLFPRFQNQLHPTTGKIWYASEIRTAARGNLLQRVFGSWLKPAGGDSALSDCYVPIRKTWVIDLALNETDEILYMGDWTEDAQGNKVPMSSWSYAVYPYGKPKPNGKIADENDARIYPYRRLIISSESCVMYDGPAFDWHGELPLIPLCLDQWAFDPAGFSLVRDGYEIQQSLNELERGVMDKNRAQLDMALAYDVNSVSTKEAMQFDPMQPRARVGYDGSLVQQPFSSPVPPEVLRIDQTAFQGIEHLEQTMDYQMGVNDIAAMARARGLVATEGVVDKLMEANGPIVMDITRSVEWSLSKIGQQVKYIIPQFFTVRKIMSYVGPNGVDQMTFDYDPESLIPSHGPDEIPTHNDRGEPEPSKYSKQERARYLADNVDYTIAPHSAHEIVQMAYKLGLIQLRKAGIQISSKTIAESWNIDNFGGPDEDTEYKRYFAEQMDVAKHAIEVKQYVDQLQATGIQPNPAMQMALAQLLGGQTQEGRPPSGQQAPQLNSKDGGERATISESGS